MKTVVLILLCFFMNSCFKAPSHIYVSLPNTKNPQSEQNSLSQYAFGSKPLDKQILDIREKIPGVSMIPPSFFQTDPLVLSCSFFRIAPLPTFQRETNLSVSLVPGSERKDGFAVDAYFEKALAEGEKNNLALWYDFRGYLMGTITLPPKDDFGNRSFIETPENREEYVVFGFSPNTQQWIGEWQRKVDPNASPKWTSLPNALLVQQRDPYHSYLKTTAYMVCQRNITLQTDITN